MAQGISGGNFFANVNAQFAKDLSKGDSQAAQTARNNSGLTAQTKRGSTPKNKQAGGEDGLGLSDAARNQLKSEAAQHSDHVAEHGHELAHQSGMSQADDAHEQGELQQKRGYDREQAEIAESSTPPGYVRVESPEGEPQLLTETEHIHLNEMDDPDFTDSRVLDDIPDANLEAASATVETQMANGVSKVAQFKTNAKIDEIAEAMEIDAADMLSEPMDIVGPGNDKLSGPMSLDFPPEMERVAAEKAALELASGAEQEVFMAGAPASPKAEPVEAAAAAGPAEGLKAAAAVGAAGAVAAAAASAATKETEAVDQPAFANQAGQPQEPVKPGFLQRLKYLFTGNQADISQAGRPAPKEEFVTQGPPHPGPVATPASYMQPNNPADLMQAQLNMQGQQIERMARTSSITMGLSSLLMMGSMFMPALMPMASFVSFMPMMMGGLGMGMGGLGLGGLGMGMGGMGMGMGGLGMGGMGMGSWGGWGMGNDPMGPTAPTGQMPNSAAASMIRYDKTPTEPGAVVVLDSFQANEMNAAPQGEVTYQAAGAPAGGVCRQELARPVPNNGWLTHPQHNQTASAIRNQMILDLAGARHSQLEGAAVNLQGLAQEGLRNSAVNLPAGPTKSAEVWSTYAGLRSAWTDSTPGQTGSRVALSNYCRAFELDQSRIMHSDPEIHGPERAKLQQALVELSNQVDKNPDVQASQQKYQAAVAQLEKQKVSVVVTGGTALGSKEMADDRGGEPLEVGAGFNKSVFSAPGTVTVGASYMDEKTSKTRAWSTTEDVDLMADAELRVGDSGRGTYNYGASSAAPKVSTALANLHAKHPDKSNSEILGMLKSECEPLNGDGPPNFSKAKQKSFVG